MNAEAMMGWGVSCGEVWVSHSEDVRRENPRRHCYTWESLGRWDLTGRVVRDTKRRSVPAEAECSVPVTESEGRPVTWLVYDKPTAARVHEAKAEKPVEKDAGLAERFAALSGKWMDESGAESSLSRIIGNIHYLRIIGMGMEAVPLIHNDLQKTGAPWFVALEAITGRTGIGAEHPGNFKKKAEMWLKWGREQGYV
jgi:hypothetical protein